LREQGVEEVGMESTAQYWRSVWLELEPLFSPVDKAVDTYLLAVVKRLGFGNIS
jgi:hypothetical protein